ncbi:integral membrane protein [Neisseria gonorrhoeae FA6140]|nr:integral membrane protein [Neisseria gonorrhoeae FA6140]
MVRGRPCFFDVFGHRIRHPFGNGRDSPEAAGVRRRHYRFGCRRDADLCGFMDEKGGAFDEAAASGFCTGGFEPWQRSRMALVGMAFLAVAREGLESVFFLLAVFKQSPTWQMPAGAVAGVLAAAVIGALIYQGGMRLNLAKFFRWTGAFLIIVAAGLLAGSLRALHEAGIWNALQDIVLDPSKYLHEDSPLGVLLGGFFGYTDHPAQGWALVWLLYLIPVMIWFLRGSRPSETLTRKEELK